VIAAEGFLYHVSEERGIEVFIPRMPVRETPGTDCPVVWAVDRDHLCNYLLPRECPRVTFRAGPVTTGEDTGKFLGGDPELRVVAVESSRIVSIRSTELFVYRFDPSSFSLQDRCAGYHVSGERVVPRDEIPVDDPLSAVTGTGAELWFLDSLWELREEVIGSTLEYSIIRMANAEPAEDPARFHPLP
jgi:hypothetical protein